MSLGKFPRILSRNVELLRHSRDIFWKDFLTRVTIFWKDFVISLSEFFIRKQNSSERFISQVQFAALDLNFLIHKYHNHRIPNCKSSKRRTMVLLLRGEGRGVPCSLTVCFSLES